MNFLLYLLTKITNYHHRPFRQYPHEDDDDECNLINEMYENGLGGIRELNFVNIYDIFWGLLIHKVRKVMPNVLKYPKKENVVQRK